MNSNDGYHNAYIKLKLKLRTLIKSFLLRTYLAGRTWLDPSTQT